MSRRKLRLRTDLGLLGCSPLNDGRLRGQVLQIARTRGLIDCSELRRGMIKQVVVAKLAKAAATGFMSKLANHFGADRPTDHR